MVFPLKCFLSERDRDREGKEEIVFQLVSNLKIIRTMTLLKIREKEFGLFVK